MENKHTAIQQLINEIVEHLTYDDDLSDDSRMTLETIRLRCLGKLSIEKEQIMDAFWNGDNTDCTSEQNSKEFAEQYYIETYESKEIYAKDVILGYKTSIDAQMLDRIEPKQENNLEEAAEKLYPKEGEDYTYGDLGLIQQDAFKFGAKWQQERMYSEEDMAESFMACRKANVSDGIECKLSFKEFIEQYKKK
jgi:hypothetical protein